MAINWCINKMWYIHTREYYSVITSKEVHDTTWINLVNIMLSQRSQSQRTIYCMIPFVENVQNRQIHEDQKQGMVSRAGGEEEWEMTAHGFRISFWGDESIPELVVMVAHLCEWTKNHCIALLTRVNFMACHLYPKGKINPQVGLFTHLLNKHESFAPFRLVLLLRLMNKSFVFIKQITDWAYCDLVPVRGTGCTSVNQAEKNNLPLFFALSL